LIQVVQYRLIAEKMAEIYPDMVAGSADGQVETVKYQVPDSMGSANLQKWHATIGTQSATIAGRKPQIHLLGERLVRVEAVVG
jgi:hypothetical protein